MDTPQPYSDIKHEEAVSIINNDPDVIVLDVRTADERALSHISGSEHIDFYDKDFEGKIAELDKHKTYVVHCHSGGRSSQTVQLMKSLGFEKVYSVCEPTEDWDKHDYTIVK